MDIPGFSFLVRLKIVLRLSCRSGGRSACGLCAAQVKCLSEVSVLVTLRVCWDLCVGHGALCMGFLCRSGLTSTEGFCASQIVGLPGVSVMVRLGVILG